MAVKAEELARSNIWNSLGATPTGTATQMPRREARVVSLMHPIMRLSLSCLFLVDDGRVAAPWQWSSFPVQTWPSRQR